jgi:hypothetical protein
MQMENKEKKYWSPYVAGACAGLVLVLSVWITGNYFGASTSFVRSAGFIEKVFNAERVSQLEYFKKTSPKIDWQWMFVIGVFFGSFIAAGTSGTFKAEAVPDMWRKKFGSGIMLRGIVAFIGGTVAMFGARLADG